MNIVRRTVFSFRTSLAHRHKQRYFSMTTSKKRDVNTNSNYTEIVMKHVTINYGINFDKKVMSGNVLLELKVLAKEGCKQIILDTSYLDISKINVKDHDSTWNVADRKEPYGSPLTISLAKAAPKDSELSIDISLSTTEQCTALQWLDPEQTSNKKHPYMFSQCQAIHARSILPCQDTPDVKAPVKYNIQSPQFVVAAGLPVDHSNGHYQYEQKIPVPSYLIAFASGDIESAPIGPRSQVLSGPDEVAGCQWELKEDMERFLQVAESIVFKYQWDQFNVLVLPASFPYGGMENVNYTFATPTIISKDKQNIDVIAHELAHSWSGNLVTNASWEHFWLNEGWTVFLERRIQAKIHGEEHRDFSAIIGWKALSDSIEQFGKNHEFTKLIPNLTQQDPDDAFSSIPYEKGYTFLSYLESLVGREKWDKFIPHYFRTWMLRSLDSFEFRETLLDFFASDAQGSERLKEVDWDTWLYAPGYPPKPSFDDSMVKVCYSLAEQWRNRATNSFEPKSGDIDGWIANQSVVFLEKLQSYPSPPLSKKDVRLLGSTYGYADSTNVELVSRFFGLALMANDEQYYEPAAQLLGTVGRMKFVRPLYRLLAACDRAFAIKVFERYRDFYHPICRNMVAKDLFGDKK